MLRTLAISLSAIAAALCVSSPPFAADATQGAADAQLGLPVLAASDAQAAERIALGRKLFMDRRLSRNGTMSCGMCHIPEQGFTVNELATAVGIEGRSLRRNAPTLLNVGYNTSLFHDGRARTLEEQAWGPLLAADEMGNSSREAVADQLAAVARLRWTVRAGVFRFGSDAGHDRRGAGRLSALARLRRFALRPVLLQGRGRGADCFGAARLRPVSRHRALRRMPHARRRPTRPSPTTSSTTSARGSTRATVRPRR